ncbi:MAG: adenylate/guanylate cyclase domain-containing protein [Burkholderiales bacterium]
MSRPLERNALRLIQDIVREATGSPLAPEARTRVESVLHDLAKGDRSAAVGQRFSRREVSILFADLRGFSAIAATHPVDVVVHLLNRCFGTMVDIIARHYGTVDKFMGDAVMVIFGGDPAAPRDHARRALLCAVEMQIAMDKLRSLHRQENVPEMFMGIGISTGKVMSGLIGSDAYRAYTIFGEEVNVAARLEALSLRGQILMSEATYAHCRDFVAAGEPTEVHVKGKGELMRVREVLGIPGLGKTVPRQDVRKSPRVAVRLDLDYRVLEGKIVRPEVSRGVIRDLGYHGLLAELAEPLPRHAELKLAFPLPALAYRASDIFARIVSTRNEHGRTVAGMEFTSVNAETATHVRLFVQMLLQAEQGISAEDASGVREPSGSPA